MVDKQHTMTFDHVFVGSSARSSQLEAYLEFLP